MLTRTDGKRLPIGVIPTGTSNDFARSIGLSVGDVSAAIRTIGLGECIAIDTTRVVIDHDSIDQCPEGERRLDYCRYMVSNASLSMPAKIANGANTWKGCCSGSSSFSMATYLQAFSCGFVADQFKLEIDDKPESGNVVTSLLMVNNGKFANGGMIMNPFASVNDGLMDITWISDPNWQGTMGVTDIMSQARGKGGIQAY